MAKKNIFVTGGGGFIGWELVKKLVESGYNVACFDLGEQIQLHLTEAEELRKSGSLKLISGTILDRNSLQRHIRGCDVVIHMAAMLGVQRTENNRLGCLEVNITGTDNVLNACVFNKVRHVIFASSSEVYGEPYSNPIKETDETKGKTVYAVSKLAGEELTKGYNQLYDDLNYTIIRFFNTYGEGQVAQFAIAKFVRAVLQNENPTVYGKGDQVRGYCHVDDTTNGICKIVEETTAFNKVYNLGNSSERLSLIDLAQTVIDTLAPDKGLSVNVLGTFEGSDRVADREIHHRFCDTTLIESELGFKPSVSLREGIERIASQGEIIADWPTPDWPTRP